MGVLDINQMAASIYETVLSLQKSAEEMVGLDTLWCRALPHQGGEDVVIQEYTLSNVECPMPLKILTDKSDYNPGTYSVDLWGVSFEAPMEISINITSWKEIYGENTAPQKGDIVYIKILNRLYEVVSSTIQYTLTSLPQAYKCSLKKYQRTASRRESDEIRISIDELTQAQDTMFGDAISNEVADAVIERETSYNQSTYVDPIRTCDLSSIITEDVIGAHQNLISHSYYDFNISAQDVIWNAIQAKYGANMDVINSHWTYSVWFRINHNMSIENKDIEVTNKTKIIESTIQLKGLYNKSKTSYQFYIELEQSGFNIGDEVILYRGNMISLSGIIGKEDCGNRDIITISTTDVLTASQKAAKWWETIKRGWKIKKVIQQIPDNYGVNKETIAKYNLLSGYNGDDKIIDITYNGTQLKIKFNNIKKNISIPNILDNEWHYMLCEFSPGNLNVIIHQTETEKITAKIYDKTILNKEYKLSTINDFSVDSFKLENANIDLNICNIRLYESENTLTDQYKLDMYSPLTRNASKLIFIDNPLPANRMDFVSPMR